MGWLSNLWDNIVDWISEKVIGPIVKWITELIGDTTAAIRVFRHETNKLIARWLDNDLVFLGTIAAVIAAAVFWPQILAFLKRITEKLTLSSIWESLKEQTAGILDWLHAYNWALINTALKVIFPQYRKDVANFRTAISQLAKEMGEGTGQIHAYFSVVHALAYVTASFGLTDPEFGELAAFQDTEAFFRTLDQDIWRYAENPSLIYTDLMDKVYIPYADRLNTVNRSTLEEIQNHRDRIDNLNSSLAFLGVSLENLIAVSTDDLRDQFEKRFGGFAEDLSELTLMVRDEILIPYGEVIDALEYRASVLERANQTIIAKIDRPSEIFMAVEIEREEEQEQFWGYLLSHLDQVRDDEAAAQMTPALETVDQGVNSALVPASRAPGMPSLGYEPAGIVPAAKTAEMRKHDWFVGEY